MAKTLICDDSILMRKVIRKILTTNGHEVVGEATNGFEAIALYKKYRPELVMMDITMPNIDGIAAAREIISEDGDAVIIMVSSLGQKSYVKQALKIGVVDFIVKPFEQEHVQLVIEKVLAKGGTQKH